jgi:hypothetical protein
VAGEAVIELVDQTGQAASVHRTEHEFAIQGTQQKQVIHYVRGGQNPVDVGVGKGYLEAVQELAAVRHGYWISANAQGSPCGMVGGHYEVLFAVFRAGMAAPRFGGARYCFRILKPDSAQVLVAAGIVVGRPGNVSGSDSHRDTPSEA